MFFPVAVLACTACRSPYPLCLSGAALPRSRSSSFTSSPLAPPHPSPVAILHRQRAFRVSPRLLAAHSMRECHPPKSPIFRPLRPLHLCSPLPKHDIDFHDVIKCNHFYCHPLPSPLSQPANSHSGVAECRPLPACPTHQKCSNVGQCGGLPITPCPLPSLPHPSSTVFRLSSFFLLPSSFFLFPFSCPCASSPNKAPAPRTQCP